MEKINGLSPFLVKDADGELEIVCREYSGAIPPKVMRKFVRYVRRQDEKGWFYPMDALDIYSQAIMKLEETAANLPPEVENPIGYLLNASRLILLKLHERITVPAREEYRRLEGVTRPAERCDAACDQELDSSCSDEERVSYDANDLAEMLIAAPDRGVTRRQARECLEETFRKLHPETVNAFRAWLRADGVIVVAAALAGEERTAYTRRFPVRCAEFRRNCSWCWSA